MASIAEIRSQYPQYDDLSDEQLADAMHSKFYADMPRPIFNAKIGLTQRGQNPHDAPEFDAPGRDRSEPRSASNSFAYGAADMAGLGFGDEAAATFAAPFSEKTRDQILQEMRGNQKEAQADNPGAYLGGQAAGAVGQALVGGPGLFAGRMAGNTLRKTALATAADSAILGGTYGAGSGETAAERGYGAGIGALGGGVLGGLAPYAVTGATNAARKIVSPFAMSPERKAAASVLSREGIETTAGQRSGSKALRYAESELGGGRAEDLMERQAGQFTEAALKRAGVSGNRASPEALDSAFNANSGMFNALGRRNAMVADEEFVPAVKDALSDYYAITAKDARAPVIESTINTVSRMMKQNGSMDGKMYQALSSRLARSARTTKEPELKRALYGLREAMDDAMERSIERANPADLGAFREARSQYRNLLTIERASTGAGENAALGLISPSALRNATVSTQGRRNFARGKGDFSELARAGEALLKPLPNSGTAGRLAAQGLPSVIGAGAGGSQGGWDGALGGAVAGFAAPRLAGKMLMSPLGQRFVGNQLLSKELPPALIEVLSRSLASSARPTLTRR